MEDQAFIGRQPIMDGAQKIIGYELFFRHSAEAENAVLLENFKAFKACASVLINTINGVDTQGLIGDKLAFINVDATMLKSDFLELLPPKRTVLEILRTVEPSNDIVERCRALRKLGFKIALDNPHLHDGLHPLLQYADFVKIDIQATKPAEAAEFCARFLLPSVKTIAEKIESVEQFETCKALGFHRFQGFYFSRPETFTTKIIDPSFDSVLDLLNLDSQDAENIDIENGFKKDPALSFKLLHYINSVGFGLSIEIQSISHALTILGRRKLYRWLTLLMVTAGDNTTPPALMKTSVTRGRLTELLGEGYFDKKDIDNLFVVGVFSLLDSILKMPMEQVLEKIQLPEAISEALLTRGGVYGPFLQLAEACESADVQHMLEIAESLQLDSSKINECHISALAWVEKLGV